VSCVTCLFVFELRFGKRFVLSRKRGEIKGFRNDSGPIDHHGRASFDLHIFHGPAGHMKRRGLTGDRAAITEGIETAAAGDAENFRDACGACDGNVFAGGKDSGGGDDVGF